MNLKIAVLSNANINFARPAFLNFKRDPERMDTGATFSAPFVGQNAKQRPSEQEPGMQI